MARSRMTMVPTGLGNQGKPGKMGRHFPVREKSGNFVKTGKVREIYSKYWKDQKKLYWKIEKNTGKVKEMMTYISARCVCIVYTVVIRTKIRSRLACV